MAPVIKCATYTVIAVFALISTAFVASAVHVDEDRKVYIVYMGEKPSGQILTQSVHLNLLDGILDGSSSRDSLVYSYTKSFNGFAAKLTEKEAKKIAGLEGIVSIFPNQKATHQTTRSWDFLHFPQNVTRNPTIESDVIVGVIDSGIWPDSESFKDDGLGPPPAKWKGICEGIKCNNKIIGARLYPGEDSGNSTRDWMGHGTHTAATVAGQSVQGASLFGIAEGTARGAVPSARIAVYKACADGCSFQNLLAAFDDAIADGVDVLSVSLGAFGDHYFENPIAIGSFHAMTKGILTSVPAGNSGPDRASVINTAPWTIVSAASSIDRRIVAKVALGDGTTLVGASVNIFPTKKQSSPLFYSGNESFLESCVDIDNKVDGKVVVCGDKSGYQILEWFPVKGAVMVDDTESDVSYQYPFPATVVSSSDGKKIFSYTKKTKKPVVNIHRSEGVLDSSAPIVASFSSRGPNLESPNILKPDITAPGINILAAWSEYPPLTTAEETERRVKYNIFSGTSMAVPHVAGAAAYVKSFHPNWSSSVIMSALMTTATPMDPTKHEGYAELSYGAGQINPVKALNPGLVYNTTVADYIQMLCDLGYYASSIRLITVDNHTTCSKDHKGDPKDLNYPSLSLLVDTDKGFTGVTFKRRVTNVGDPKSHYTAKISADPKLKVTIKPQTLSFTKLNEEQTFVVTVSGGPLKATSVASASVVWSDGKHDVRSALVVYTADPQAVTMF